MYLKQEMKTPAPIPLYKINIEHIKKGSTANQTNL